MDRRKGSRKANPKDAKILTEEPKRPSELRKGVRPDLEHICLKMMARKIEDRYRLGKRPSLFVGIQRVPVGPAPIDRGPPPGQAEVGPRGVAFDLSTVSDRRRAVCQSAILEEFIEGMPDRSNRSRFRCLFQISAVKTPPIRTEGGRGRAKRAPGTAEPVGSLCSTTATYREFC